MTKKKRPSAKKGVATMRIAGMYPDPLDYTLRLSPEESRKLLIAAAIQPDFARKLSGAIRDGNLALIQSLCRARGISCG